MGKIIFINSILTPFMYVYQNYNQPRPFSAPYASIMINNNEDVLLVWRIVAFIAILILLVFDLVYVQLQFFLYYHHWSILTVLVSFLMLFWDSVIHLAPDEFFPVFQWFKEALLDVMFEIG